MITYTFSIDKEQYEDIKTAVRTLPTARFKSNPNIIGNKAYFSITFDNNIDSNNFTKLKEQINLKYNPPVLKIKKVSLLTKILKKLW